MNFTITVLKYSDDEKMTSGFGSSLMKDGALFDGTHEDALVEFTRQHRLSAVAQNLVYTGRGRYYSAVNNDCQEVNFWIDEDGESAEWFERSFDYESGRDYALETWE